MQKTVNQPSSTTDRLGRPLGVVRLSVTDRCNFRCRYCMPREHFGNKFEFLPRKDILSFEEITRLAGIFAGFSVKTFRLTGGEPLLRRDIERLVESLAKLETAEVALTTNGSLLKAKAKSLRAAGLRRLTVSLDALDDQTFSRMNDVDFPVADVLAGIDVAAAAGFPIKINAVIRRGTNEHSVLDLVRYFKPRGHTVRFIEYMDVGETNAWRLNDVVSKREILKMIESEFPLEKVETSKGQVAQTFRYKDGTGEIGIITSVTEPFCNTCDRARLSADGKLYTCLFASVGFDIKTPMRAGASDQELTEMIQKLWQARSDRYSELRAGRGKVFLPRAEMSYLGG